MPALTFGVSTNFALANFLASRSIRNVSVALAYARFPCGSSNETYHVPWDLLAMIPSRELRRRLTGLGRSPLATCRISPAIFPDLVAPVIRVNEGADRWPCGRSSTTLRTVRLTVPTLTTGHLGSALRQGA